MDSNLSKKYKLNISKYKWNEKQISINILKNENQMSKPEILWFDLNLIFNQIFRLLISLICEF